MMKHALAAAMLLGAAAAAPTAAAQSGPACAPRESVVKLLEKGFTETRRGAGLLRDESGVIEVWTARETGSWTIVLTRPDGTACVLAAGEHWTGLGPDLASLGDPA